MDLCEFEASLVYRESSQDSQDYIVRPYFEKIRALTGFSEFRSHQPHVAVDHWPSFKKYSAPL